MANNITGRKASTGLVPCKPISEPASPHWKTATNMPSAAPMERRFMTAAVSGITKLRNTVISSKNDKITTSPMKSGNFELSTFAKSM